MSKHERMAAALAMSPEQTYGMDELAPVRRRRPAPVAPATSVPPATSGTRLVVLVGAGNVGKSVIARLLAEWAQEQGRTVGLVDADRHHATLSSFFAGAMRPEDGLGDAELTDAAMAGFYEQMILGMLDQRASVVFDVTGGDTTFARLADELDLGALLAARDVMPVVMHVVGPRIQDLTDLQQMEESSFRPVHTVLVLNEGTVRGAAVPERAFDAVRGHPVYRAALARGAVEVVLPALEPMREVDRRRLLFAEAAAGTVKPGQAPLSPFDAARVRTWLPRAVAAFAPVREWLP